MIKREIKNCPFCGSFAECVAHDMPDTDDFHYIVQCCDCLCATYPKNHPQDAIDIWNTRATEQQ